MVARFVVRMIVGLAIMGLLLFGVAGTTQWPGAWALLSIFAALGLGGGLWLARHDPALLRERMGSLFQRDQATWDRRLMLGLIPLWLGWFVVMALDRRFDWSSVPPWAQMLGALLLLVMAAIALLTFRENSFAAPVVKIQRARGHAVVSTGPYAYVRHPMYASVIFYAAGVPLLLGSWWGLILAPVLMSLLAVRALFEERLLSAELAGYADYAARVPYRLVPGLW